MWPDRVSNPRPLTYESGALPTVLLGSASRSEVQIYQEYFTMFNHCYQFAFYVVAMVH